MNTIYCIIRFQCQLCSSSFLQLPHLKKHMRCIHKKDRPYVCLPCNEFFQTKNELTLHTASHNKDEDQQQSQDPSDSAEEDESSSSSNDQEQDNNKSPASKTNVGTSQVVHLPNGTKIELKMRLAILLKRISTPSRLRRLGYGTKLIDIVLTKSIESSGRKAVLVAEDGSSDARALLKCNIEILLDWTIPREFMERFRQEGKTVEEILEELTS